MNFIFKFYLKKVSLETFPRKRIKLEAFEGQQMFEYIGRSILYLPPKEEFLEHEIFEIIFDAISLKTKSIRGILESQFKTEVLKHANDVNESTERDIAEYSKQNEIIPIISSEQIQEIIDRSYLYGSEFTKQLMVLLDEFPVKVEMVKAEKNDNAASQRKVSKI